MFFASLGNYMHLFYRNHDSSTMFYFNEDCFSKSLLFDAFNNTILIIATVFLSTCSLVSNIIGSIGICRLYKTHMTRTPKLLLSLFVTNFIAVLVAECVYSYHFIKGFLASWYFFVHLSVLVFLTLWSSITVLLVTFDRFLIVVRGKWYLFWKRRASTIISMIFVCAILFTIYIYFGFKRMTCLATKINLLSFAFALASNTCATVVTNIKMIRFVRINVSLVGNVGVNLRNDVATMVYAMTLSSTFFQTCLFTLLGFFVSSYTSQIIDAGYGGVFVVSSTMLIALHAGTLPLVYVFKNRRLFNTLRCM